MGLTKYKLGELVEIVDERNDLGIRDFYGINKSKEFMPTVANTANLDESKYKIVRKNRFVFSGMQTGRDKSIRLVMYTKNKPIIVSPAYTTFEIKKNAKVIPLYFFMIFLSEEKDRLGWFLSDASIRANLDWEVFCDIDINLPSIEIQKKYVAIYQAMLENKKAYEEGLEDLKLACDGTTENIKKNGCKKSLSELCEEVDIRNKKLEASFASGVNIEKRIIKSKAKVSTKDLKNYKIIKENQFVFSGMQTGRDETIRIAKNNSNSIYAVSPAYTVLQINKGKINADYFMLWFSRKETDRYGWFISDASIRSNIDLDRFFEIEIPVPTLKIQNSIANIYKVYTERKEINEKLKEQIKSICPILIKGAMEEADREGV